MYTPEQKASYRRLAEWARNQGYVLLAYIYEERAGLR